MNILILGAGTWGLALANTLAYNDVTVWSPLSNEIEQLNKTYNHKNLPDVNLRHSIKFVTKLDNLVDEDFIVVAVPSIFVRSTVERLKGFISEKTIIVNVAKGIESGSLLFYLMSSPQFFPITQSLFYLDQPMPRKWLSICRQPLFLHHMIWNVQRKWRIYFRVHA